MQKGALIAVCAAVFPCVLLSGCGNSLNKKRAHEALRPLVEAEARSKFSVSRQDVKAGDFIQPDYAVKYGCEGTWRPSMIDEAEKSAAQGLIELKKTGPCSWRGDLKPQFRSDVAWEYTDPGHYTSIDLNTSKYKSLEIKEAHSVDEHGEAIVALHFAFTPTMLELMKHSVYPEIDDKDCEYDIPKSEVVCTQKLPFMYVDKQWKIDPTKIKKVEEK